VALLEGEYGERDVAMGVPCILDETGLSAVVELELNETERGDFDTSVAAVREDIGRLAALG
jgi:malate dehydrogenase